jgi:coenzyme F420-0:L-glutamate ligase/coenzyme F420-1:gamma-L-glutamate ligase
MSEIAKAIKNRRSIRKYNSKQVSKKDIEDFLEAAGWAPSAHNAQPWRFIVLENAALKQRLSEAMVQAWEAYQIKEGVKVEEAKKKPQVERFSAAPGLIVACLTMDGMKKIADVEKQLVERDLAMQSLGAAIQNLLLTVHSKGLGACWYSAPSFCKQTVRIILKIPVDVEPQAFITLGYPMEPAGQKSRKKLGDYSFIDSYEKKFSI